MLGTGEIMIKTCILPLKLIQRKNGDRHINKKIVQRLQEWKCVSYSSCTVEIVIKFPRMVRKSFPAEGLFELGFEG